jgi:rubrerythrin
MESIQFAMPNDPKSVDALRQNWRAEVETSRVYRDLAERETEPKRKSILLRMAEAEERHAARWAQKLKELGQETPAWKDSLGQRFNRWWNRIAGLDVAIRRMEAAEDRHEARYRAQSERALANDPDAQKFLREAALEEKAHARVLNKHGIPNRTKERTRLHLETGTLARPRRELGGRRDLRR